MSTWSAISQLTKWLDENSPIEDPAQSMALRLLKVTEEAGEAAQAYIGYTGQNPRKGTTHSRADVLSELVDVAVTAMVAMESLAPGEAEQAFADRIDALHERLGLTAP